MKTRQVRQVRQVRTDSTGNYELLVRSKCPHCSLTVYLAKNVGEGEEGNLFVLHENSESGECAELTEDLARDPQKAAGEMMDLADPSEIEAFLRRASALLN